MQTALKFLYTLSISLWVGSIFFFSFMAAPSIFKVLPRETAGNVVSDIFPKYYMVGYVCGAVAIIAAAVLWFVYSSRGGIVNYLRIGGLLLMLGFTLYAGQVVLPVASGTRAEMRTLNEGSPEYQVVYKKFRLLHARSAIMNASVLVLGIAILAINAYTNKE